MQPEVWSQPRVPLLLVDDDAPTREVMRIIFGDAGYTVIEASNGTDALVVLRERSAPLVVLLDVLMPQLSGEEVLRAVLRDRHLRRRHTFILVSALPHLSRRLRLQRLLRALAIEVVTKPFDVADLEQAVAHAQTRQPRRPFFGRWAARW
jgi:CheY-like chemotaxis protein